MLRKLPDIVKVVVRRWWNFAIKGAFAQEAPPPPPAAVAAYKKKGEESAGVIAMMVPRI